MTDGESELIRKFKAGDKSAANELIGKYYDRVVRAAKRRLEGVRIRVTSEDDIAASVFESLWKRADQKRFNDQDLASPEELWKLLCTIVRFKTRDHVRHEKAQRRGGDVLRGESLFADADRDTPGLANFPINDDSIAGLAGFREQHELMMEQLGNDTLREVVTMRLEGYKVREIAEHYSRSEKWVKRKLALIRDLWADEVSKN